MKEVESMLENSVSVYGLGFLLTASKEKGFCQMAQMTIPSRIA